MFLLASLENTSESGSPKARVLAALVNGSGSQTRTKPVPKKAFPVGVLFKLTEREPEKTKSPHYKSLSKWNGFVGQKQIQLICDHAGNLCVCNYFALYICGYGMCPIGIPTSGQLPETKMKLG